MLNKFLSEIFTGEFTKALSILERRPLELPVPLEVLTMLRLSIFKPEQNFLTYQRLFNIWAKWGHPVLKLNSTKSKVFFISDFTADNFCPMIKLFCAAQGVEVEVISSGFDSIEQTVLDPSSLMYKSSPDIVILVFSELWLQRYIGNSSLIKQNDLDALQNTISGLISSIKSNSSADILIGNMPGRAFTLPAGTVSLEGVMGWNIALNRLNEWLVNQAGGRVNVVDIAEAIFTSGGRQAMGNTNYFRARMAFEMPGMLSVARELSSAICHLSGKTHRALVTDWDNTLWGGEVAELGSFGIECGHDTPEALGFLMTQEYLKSLRSLGVLLAGVSRNDPKVKKIFVDNKELALGLDDFSSIQLGWFPKSDSISQVSKELGFGSDLMVYLDDSLFEIAQVLSAHPYMDVIMAGPDSQATINRLAHYRFFNSVSLSSEDLKRSSRALKLKEQREFKTSFSRIEDFLEAIQVRLTFSKLNPENLNRVVQLFQKTNQFNLTTRRHREEDLKKLKRNGGQIYSVSYEDTFGSQGIISVIALVQKPDVLFIESWLMSCRVLNRTVEQAVFEFILTKANGKQVKGEYIPTEKNELVQSLFKTLGFKKNISAQENNSTKIEWIYANYDLNDLSIKHYALVKEV
jgi:FkbH-like protein